MTDLETTHRWLKPQFISDGVLDLPKILLAFEEEGREISRFVLSTRLDSDDVMLPHFLSFVQEAARRYLAQCPAESCSCPTTLFNYALGYQRSADAKSYFAVHPSNAFLSILDDRIGKDSLVSCYDFSHPDAFRHVARIRQLSKPSWVQLLHGDNEGNTIAGVRIPATFAPKIDFGDRKGRSRSRMRNVLADMAGLKTLGGIFVHQRTAFYASLRKR
jgi:hypothetical protein